MTFGARDRVRTGDPQLGKPTEAPEITRGCAQSLAGDCNRMHTAAPVTAPGSETAPNSDKKTGWSPAIRERVEGRPPSPFFHRDVRVLVPTVLDVRTPRANLSCRQIRTSSCVLENTRSRLDALESAIPLSENQALARSLLIITGAPVRQSLAAMERTVRPLRARYARGGGSGYSSWLRRRPRLDLCGAVAPTRRSAASEPRAASAPASRVRPPGERAGTDATSGAESKRLTSGSP
jgi:hypothetical protein